MTTLQEAAQRALVALEYHTQQTRPIQHTEDAIKALIVAIANEPQAEPVARALTYEDADEIPCPQCNGSGTETSLSGGGPDAYDVEHDCSHCAGNQTLGAAYRSLIQDLKAAQKARAEACARLYAAPIPAEQPGAVGLSDEQIDTLMPIGEADVLWFDPASRFGPEPCGKIIDASMAFMSSAPLGAKLFSREQVRETVRAALAAAQPVAADPEDAAKLQAKIENNQWDHISDFMPVFDAAMAGKWNWFENTDCKYVELWIDMRDGGCLIKNRRRERISPAQFARQWSTAPAATQGAKT